MMASEGLEPSPKKHVAVTSSFFPVAEALLPQLRISAAQHEELRDFALQAALNTVRDGPSWGRSNVERAVADGWKVLSARPTACFLVKRQSKKKARHRRKKAHKLPPPQPNMGQADDKRTAPRTPSVGAPWTPGFRSLPSGSGATALGFASSTISTTSSTAVPRGLGATGASSQPSQRFAAFSPVPLENTSGQCFMAHAVLPNSLEDVMSSLYCEHTREMRASKRKVYGGSALDCCVLETLEGATLEDPFWYLGLKWMALRSPMQRLVASREFVFLEHSGTHIDPETGRRLLYRVMQSVQIRGYGGQDSYFGLTRGHVEAAFVYWMDDDAEVRQPLLHVCAKGRVHMRGKLPAGLMYRYLKAFWRSERSLFPVSRSSASGSDGEAEQEGQDEDLATLNFHDMQLQLQPQPKKKKKKKSRRRHQRRPKSELPAGPPLEMAQEWVADEARQRCAVCNKKFRLVRRFKHHCRACGEVICRDCTYHHRINVRDTRSHESQPSNTRSLQSQHQRQHQFVATNMRPTVTDSMDLLTADEDGNGDGSWDAALSLVKPRRVGELEPEPAPLLGGNPVVCVIMAKVCRRCLHSVPLVHGRRRNSLMSFVDAELPSLETNDQSKRGSGMLRLPQRAQSWAANATQAQELRELEEELELPMLVADADAQSVDGLELKAGPTPQRVMLLSPHALSSSSSVSSSQMRELLSADESGHDSSGNSRSSGRRGFHSASDTDGERELTETEDEDEIEFRPGQSTMAVAGDAQPALREGDGESGYVVEGFDPDCLFELQDDAVDGDALAAAAAIVSDTERVLRRMRGLQDEALYQHQERRQQENATSPSSSRTSWDTDEDEQSVVSEPMQGVRQALAQMESSLADQARLLFCIEQERQRDAATAAAVAESKP